MVSIHGYQPEGTDAQRAVRRRLYAFLSRPDATVAEIVDVSGVSRSRLGFWIVGAMNNDAVEQKISWALDLVEAADRGLEAV